MHDANTGRTEEMLLGHLDLETYIHYTYPLNYLYINNFV